MENSSSHNLFRVDDITIKEDMPTKALSNNLPKIAVIGVGGGGCNMINYMIEEIEEYHLLNDCTQLENGEWLPDNLIIRTADGCYYSRDDEDVSTCES